MPRPKDTLGKLIRIAGEIFTVSSASEALNMPTENTSKSLARWTKQGWLVRVRRGLYAIIPIDAPTNKPALEDNWILAEKIFNPCYIGGWSAAEYWDFTEQIFRDICIVTERNFPQKKHNIYNISFIATRMKNALSFGTKTIWRKDKKIKVSDPHKTIIDIINDPALGGGIQHVMECFQEYLNSQYCNLEVLANYTDKINNGAIYKRLGFLCEINLGTNHLLTKLCKSSLTQGNAYLDPDIKKNSLITRWKLFVPSNIKEKISDSKA